MPFLSDLLAHSHGGSGGNSYGTALPLLPGQLPVFGGGYFKCFFTSTTFSSPSTKLRIRLWGGGAGITSNGQTSSVNALISATGGVRNGGAGGAGSGGDFQASGGSGGTGIGGGGAAGSELGNGGNGGNGGTGPSSYMFGGGGGGVGNGHGQTVVANLSNPGSGGSAYGIASTVTTQTTPSTILLSRPGSDIYGKRGVVGYPNGGGNPTSVPFPFPCFAFTGGGGFGVTGPNAYSGNGGPGAGGGGGSWLYPEGSVSGLGGSLAGSGGGFGTISPGGYIADNDIIQYYAPGGGAIGRPTPTFGTFNDNNIFIGGGAGGCYDTSNVVAISAGGGGGGYARGIFNVTLGQVLTITVAASNIIQTGNFATSDARSGGLVIIEW